MPLILVEHLVPKKRLWPDVHEERTFRVQLDPNSIGGQRATSPCHLVSSFPKRHQRDASDNVLHRFCCNAGHTECPLRTGAGQEDTGKVLPASTRTLSFDTG